MVVQLRLETLCDEHGLSLLLTGDGKTRHQVRQLCGMFGFNDYEREFAELILRKKRHLWLFRCNQQQFCGDFIVVDMSCPIPERRQVYVVELKQRRDLKVGQGVGLQLRNAGAAVAEIAESTGALPRGARYQLLLGGRRAIATVLGLSTEEAARIFPRPAYMESVYQQVSA